MLLPNQKYYSFVLVDVFFSILTFCFESTLVQSGISC